MFLVWMICLLCFSVVQRLGRFASSSQCEICNFPKKTTHTDAFSIRALEPRKKMLINIPSRMSAYGSAFKGF